MILVEPTVSGNQHVSFLVAMLRAVTYAYPDEPLIFISNSVKNRAVKLILSRQIRMDNIVFCDMYNSVKLDEISWFNRQISLIMVCFKYLYKSRDKHTGVIFFSTHWPMVLYMRWIKRLPWFCKKSVVVVHDALSLLESDKLINPLSKLEYLNNNVVILSESIAEIMSNKLNNMVRFNSINLPCVWVNNSGNVHLKKPLKFGFIGESKKGLGLFYKIAKNITAVRSGVEFWTIGSSSVEEVDKYSDILKGLSDKWLAAEEYNQRINSMLFLILPYNDKRYNYRASATFVDGLSFVKPGVYISNCYIDECMEALGEVGIVCDDAESVEKALIDIIDNMTDRQYLLYQKNILEARDVFSTKAVGKQIKAIFDK